MIIQSAFGPAMPTCRRNVQLQEFLPCDSDVVGFMNTWVLQMIPRLPQVGSYMSAVDKLKYEQCIAA